MGELNTCPCCKRIVRCVVKKNNPLTIKELKMMVGRPVWVVSEHKKEWCIVHSYHSPDVCGGGIIVTTRTSQKRTLPYYNIHLNWDAYREEWSDNG